jgi:hypothetical protein
MSIQAFRWIALAVSCLAGCGSAPPAARSATAVAMTARSAGAMTALAGLASAERAALNWDDKARLARISGGPMMAGYLVDDWSYTYVSARRPREMVVVSLGDTGLSVRVTSRDAALEALTERPRIDSDQAVAVAVRQGMAPGRLDVFTLDQANLQRRAIWTLIAPEGVFRLDARTGLFLP